MDPRLDPLSAWRFAKFVGVALYAAGVLGAVFVPSPAARRICAQWVGLAGLLVICVAGYGLVKQAGLSIGTPWISRSLLIGLAGYGAATLCAVRDRPQRSMRAIAIGCLTAALGLMSSRGGPLTVLLAALAPALAASVTWMLAKRLPEDPKVSDPRRPAATFTWFAWLARAEGLSLLSLFGLYMPLKYGMGIQLDGGQGWFGWMHGVLQLLFIVGLLVCASVHRWSATRVVLGVIASLLPLGTFIFERRTTPASG